MRLLLNIGSGTSCQNKVLRTKTGLERKVPFHTIFQNFYCLKSTHINNTDINPCWPLQETPCISYHLSSLPFVFIIFLVENKMKKNWLLYLGVETVWVGWSHTVNWVCVPWKLWHFLNFLLIPLTLSFLPSFLCTFTRPRLPSSCLLPFFSPLSPFFFSPSHILAFSPSPLHNYTSITATTTVSTKSWLQGKVHFVKYFVCTVLAESSGQNLKTGMD